MKVIKIFQIWSIIGLDEKYNECLKINPIIF